MGTSVVVDEESSRDASRRWDPTYGQFSDAKAAGQYHRIAAELASQKDTQVEISVPSYNFFQGRASMAVRYLENSPVVRRRDPLLLDPLPLEPIIMPYTPEPLQLAPEPEEPAPLKKSTSQSGTKANIHSAFDSDSDDDRRAGWRRTLMTAASPKSEERQAPAERTVIPSIRQRLEEPDVPSMWARRGDQMKDLLASARDRARLLQVSKAERRREELRKRIKVVSGWREE